MARKASDFNLGYGFMGNGMTVWNRCRMEHGDYETVAHINHDRTVRFYKNDLPKEIKENIRHVAATSTITISATQDTPVFSVPPQVKLTWDDVKKKYPALYADGSDETRSMMTSEQERRFVADCFDAYENGGFDKVFRSPYKSEAHLNGKRFEVVGRVQEGEADLECLPMWKIRFEDGLERNAYPEEICLDERK